MRKFKSYLLKIMVYFSVVYFVNRGRRHVYVMESHHSFNACRSMNTIDFFLKIFKKKMLIFDFEKKRDCFTLQIQKK